MTNKIKIKLYNKRIKKKGFTTVNVPNEIIEKYRYVCKKTRNMDNFDIYKKLNRIFFLAKLYKDNIYKYGNLNIVYDKETNTIIDLENTYGVEVDPKYCFKCDTKKRLDEVYEVVHRGIKKYKRKNKFKNVVEKVS